MPSVLVSIPSRGHIKDLTAISLLKMGKTPIFQVSLRSTSILTFTFNSLWVNALNHRGKFDYFVMLHDDVEPIEDGWLDVLVAEYEKNLPDILSVVLPIKDNRGLTSTAFMDPKTRRQERLTMTQACQYPTTFSGDAFQTRWVVMPNTGLWICDFRKPWVEKICFTNRDRIFRDQNGTWYAQAYGEDWDLGGQCEAMGLKVMATTAVKAMHHGEFAYPNFTPFGTLKTDDQVNYWIPPERHYNTGAEAINLTGGK